MSPVARAEFAAAATAGGRRPRRPPQIARDNFDLRLRRFAQSVLRQRSRIAGGTLVAATLALSSTTLVDHGMAFLDHPRMSDPNAAGAMILAPALLALGLGTPVALAAPVAMALVAAAFVAAASVWFGNPEAARLAAPATMMALVVACTASTHFLTAFQRAMAGNGNRRRAVLDATELVGRPIATSVLATAAVLFGASFVEPERLRLGALLGAGAILATLPLSIAVLPALLSYGIDDPRPTADRRRALRAHDARMAKWADRTREASWAAVALTVFVAGTLLAALTRLDRTFLPALAVTMAAALAAGCFHLLRCRDGRAALLATLPAVTTAAALLATAALVGHAPSGLGLLALAAAMTFAGDGAIHYFAQFRRVYLATASIAAGHRHAFRATAPASAINGIALTGAALALSQTTTEVAAIAAAATLTGWLTTLLVLPPLVDRLEPYRAERRTWIENRRPAARQST
jgi:predicted RND superfamily exporter protein